MVITGCRIFSDSLMDVKATFNFVTDVIRISNFVGGGCSFAGGVTVTEIGARRDWPVIVNHQEAIFVNNGCVAVGVIQRCTKVGRGTVRGGRLPHGCQECHGASFQFWRQCIGFKLQGTHIFEWVQVLWFKIIGSKIL